MRTRAFLAAMVVVAGMAVLPAPSLSQKQTRHNRIVDLLAQGKVVLGWFAPQRTPDAAKKAAGDPLMDFMFVNMEQVASYRPDEIKVILQTLRESGISRNPNDRPLMARIPIFHDDPVAARQRVAEMLSLGVHAIVFPDMESREEAQDAIRAMRYARGTAGQLNGTRPDDTGQAPDYWGVSPDDYRRKADVYPINPNGELASIFIIESEKGLANSREITAVRPTVAIPGPGTLRRVFKGDMTKVEEAIQTQLASCKALDVPCGITANTSDIEKRIKEGFRFFVIYDRDYADTIKVGRTAASR